MEDAELRLSSLLTRQLKWCDEESRLDLLSQRVYNFGITESEISFSEAVRNRRFFKIREDMQNTNDVHAKGLKHVHFMILFVSELIEQRVLIARKVKWHYTATKNLFYDFSSRLKEEIDFTKMKYEVQHRQFHQYDNERETVKKILIDIIPVFI